MKKSVTTRRETRYIRKGLSEACRCGCSSVCFITGPGAIRAGGGSETYTLDITHLLNQGCRKNSSKHKSTEWTKGGQRAAGVKLLQPKKLNVKVSVAAGTKAGTFTLTATPTTTAKCKETNAVVSCSSVPDTATIKVTP